ncbi:MAG: hypothetical protein JST91_02455 [Actinobacteria bacterium]|nr:hypothetical protein [Actinomycetota bacterium]
MADSAAEHDAAHGALMLASARADDLVSELKQQIASLAREKSNIDHKLLEHGTIHCLPLLEHIGGQRFRLIAVLAWLRQNPASGLLIRQLPVPGVDTKWVGTHRVTVTSLAVPLGVPEHLGLRERELLRAVAILDPAHRRGLPRLFAASDSDLATLEMRPPQVLVVENLQTLEALRDVPDTVAVFGWGGHAMAVAEFPWVRDAPRVRYWGDLDADGFAILARFRAKRSCESLLMDVATIEGWRDLAVQHPATEPVDASQLTVDKLAALELLRRDGLRLEQERIPINIAMGMIRG